MKNKLYWILTGGHFLTDFYSNLLPAILPIMVSRLHISLGAASMVVTASLLTANFFQPIVGYLFDKTPSRAWLSGAIVISGVFICISGIMPNYMLFLLCPLIAGLGNGIYHPAGSAYVYQIAERNQSFAMSVFSSVGVLGCAAGPMIAAFFIVHWGMSSLLFLLLPGVWVLYLFFKTDFNRLTFHHKKGLTVSPGNALTAAFIILTVVMTLRAWGQLAIVNLLPFFLQERGYSYTLAETLLTVFLLIGASGSILTARFSNHRSRKSLLIVSLFLSTIALSSFMIYRGIPSIICLFICAFLIKGADILAIILAQDMLPDNIGLASGISMGFAWGVGAIGFAGNGLVANHFNLTASYWLTALVIGLAFLVSLLLIKKQTPI